MAFCGNCGNEIPEGMKFCPNCGTAVGTVNNAPAGNTENGVYQRRPAPATSTRIMEIPAEASSSEPASGIDKFGKFYGIGLFVLAIVCFFSDPAIVTILLSGVIIVGTAFCLNRKYKLKAFTIIALILAVICLLCGIWQAKQIGLFKVPKDSDYSNTSLVTQDSGRNDVTETKPSSSSASNSSTSSSSEKSTPVDKEEEKTDMVSTGGVDPDLKAFLDSYEDFMDEYIEFMQKYMANPTDLTLLGEYADMMQKCSDFEEKVNKYDTKEMSTADAAYYLEVTNRVTQKMLKIYSN